MSAIHKEYLEICRLIDRHEIVSFDIYDTALLRNVLHPEDIFDIVSLEMNKKGIRVEQFKKIRIKAEEKARVISKLEDITLDDIYNDFIMNLGLEISNIIKNIELEVERKFTVDNPFIKRVYEYAVSNDKKVIFISDMYLPKKFIAELLNENGYSSEQLYVSGDVGVTKASKNLYTFIKNDLKISSPWLHIGDNKVSDYKNAIESKLEAYYYQDVRTRAEVKNSDTITKSVMKAIQVNFTETTSGLNYWQRFGAEVVSSLFFGFTCWLVNNMKGKDNLYFLSRDGYLPYLIYCKLAETNAELPIPVYIHASRRAYQLPNMLNMGKEELLEILTAINTNVGQQLTLGEVFENANLEKDKYLHLIIQYGFSSYDFVINSKKDIFSVKEILNFLYEDILEELSKELALLKGYFRDRGIYNYNEINIVDVGWRGSSQKVIQDVTKIPTNGYYLGTNFSVYNDIADRVHGYAFNLGKPIGIMTHIMENVMMYEMIFSAAQGTLVGFELRDNRIHPLLSNVENDSYYYEVLNNIQNSVLEIIDKYVYYLDYLEDITSQDCLDDYMQLIKNKNYDDLIEFSKLSGIVGIGNSKNARKYVTSVSIREYKDNRKKINAEIHKNLWKDALIIYGSINDLNKKSRKWNLRQFVTSARIIKAIKNPKKAVNFIFRYIK